MCGGNPANRPQDQMQLAAHLRASLPAHASLAGGLRRAIPHGHCNFNSRRRRRTLIGHAAADTSARRRRHPGDSGAPQDQQRQDAGAELPIRLRRLTFTRSPGDCGRSGGASTMSTPRRPCRSSGGAQQIMNRRRMRCVRAMNMHHVHGGAPTAGFPYETSIFASGTIG